MAASVAQTVIEYGCGVLDISRCRIPYLSESDKTQTVGKGVFEREPGIGAAFPHHKKKWGEWRVTHAGRWPANVILQGAVVVADLDEQSGILVSGKPTGVRNTGGTMLAGGGNQYALTGFGDSGGASRFFKQVK